MRPERRFLAALGAFAIALVVAFFVVRARFAATAIVPPSKEARAWALEALDAARLGRPVPEAPSSARAYEAPRPIRVLAFASGGIQASSERSTNLRAAVLAAIDAFRVHPVLRADPSYTTDASATHFSIAVPLGAAPLPMGVPVLERLSLVPTRDGISVRFRGRRETLSPDDLLERDLDDRGYVTPLPEVYAGVPMDRIVALLANRLETDVASLREEGRFERLPTATITRDVYPKRRPISRATVRAGVSAATDYLVSSESSGTFDYLVDARASQSRPEAGYNLARHAGTAYFLAQSARVLGRTDARDASRRAIDWVVRVYGHRCGAADHLCITDEPRARIGASALTLVAIGELSRTSPEPALRVLAVALAEFLLAQQRPDGELMHVYDLARRERVDVQYLYFNGEAALAFLYAHEMTGDARYLEAARRLLLRLSNTAWTFPGSRYVYNEEHWTCIALGESEGRLDLPSLREFCRRVYLWNDRLQYRSGEGPWDATGGYGVTRFLVPRTPPAATRGEAFVAAYGALARHGDAPDGMRAHIERALSQLLAHQYTPGPTRFFAFPDRLFGGMPGSVVDLDLRNDYAQHAGSALARYLDLLEREHVSGPDAR